MGLTLRPCSNVFSNIDDWGDLRPTGSQPGLDLGSTWTRPGHDMNVAAVKDLQPGDRGWRRPSPRSFGSSKATLGVSHVTSMEPRSLREALSRVSYGI